MYYCRNCHSEFETPKTVTEKHGLTSPPFESFCVCPFCLSADYKEITVKYCHCCGARLSNVNKTYCNDSCRIAAERLRKKEALNREKLIGSQLTLLLREVERYNAENNTKFSYGQYVAIIRPKLLRSKNAKKEDISEKLSVDAKENCSAERNDSIKP